MSIISKFNINFQLRQQPKTFQFNSNSDNIAKKSIEVTAVQFWFSNLSKYILFDWLVNIQVHFKLEIKMVRKSLSLFEAAEFCTRSSVEEDANSDCSRESEGDCENADATILVHQMITWQIVKAMNWFLIMWQVYCSWMW